MTDSEMYLTIIEQRIAELKEGLTKVEHALSEPADADLEDQAIELEDDEVLEGVGRASQREIRYLEDALKRIANGTFGICIECGESISKARLDAVPYAVLCKDCVKPVATSG